MVFRGTTGTDAEADSPWLCGLLPKIGAFLLSQFFHRTVIQVFLDQSAFFNKLVSDVLRLEIVNPARVEIPCNMPVRCKTIIHFPVKFFPVCRIINQEVVQYGQAPLGGFPAMVLNGFIVCHIKTKVNDWLEFQDIAKSI